jgi:hypothetical protein
MYALLALVAFIVFIEVAALRGWGTDSRDGRDWNVPQVSAGSPRARHTPAGPTRTGR